MILINKRIASKEAKTGGIINISDSRRSSNTNQKSENRDNSPSVNSRDSGNTYPQRHKIRIVHTMDKS